MCTLNYFCTGIYTNNLELPLFLRQIAFHYYSPNEMVIVSQQKENMKDIARFRYELWGCVAVQSSKRKTVWAKRCLKDRQKETYESNLLHVHGSGLDGTRQRELICLSRKEE